MDYQHQIDNEKIIQNNLEKKGEQSPQRRIVINQIKKRIEELEKLHGNKRQRIAGHAPMDTKEATYYY